MPNDFDRRKEGGLVWQKDRDFAAREAREQLAAEHRKHLERSGKHISHTKAREYIDKLADGIDRKG